MTFRLCKFNVISYSLLYAVLIVSIVFSGCKKDSPSLNEYQENIGIKTGSFSLLSSKEIELHGNIASIESTQILEHGFVWYKDKGVENQLSLGKPTQAGEVAHLLTNNEAFEQQEVYRYYYYVRTSKAFIKGEIKTFVLSNIQFSVYGTRASVGRDTISIDGVFDGLDDDYRIQVTGAYELFSVPYQLDADKKKITFILAPTASTAHESEVEVMLVRKNQNPYKSQRQILKIKYYATIIPPLKTVHRLNDYLEFLHGDVLPYSVQQGGLMILINDLKIPYERYIMLANYPTLRGSTFRLGYSNGREEVYFPEPIKLEVPTPTDFSLLTPEAHPGTPFLMKIPQLERFFPIDRSIDFGGKGGELYGANSSGECVFYPQQSEPGEYRLTIANQYYDVALEDKFIIKELNWTGLDRKSAYMGESVVAKGNFISGQEYVVYNQKDEDIGQYIGESGRLEINITNGFEGMEKLKIGYFKSGRTKFFTSHEENFTSEGVTLDQFYPNRGMAGDILTLKGKGIALAHFYYLGDQPLTGVINSKDPNTVSFSIPLISGKGKMRISYRINEKIYQSDELFELY